MSRWGRVYDRFPIGAYEVPDRGRGLGGPSLLNFEVVPVLQNKTAETFSAPGWPKKPDGIRTRLVVVPLSVDTEQIMREGRGTVGQRSTLMEILNGKDEGLASHMCIGWRATRRRDRGASCFEGWSAQGLPWNILRTKAAARQASGAGPYIATRSLTDPRFRKLSRNGTHARGVCAYGNPAILKFRA
jgi:hypothetical protein